MTTSGRKGPARSAATSRSKLIVVAVLVGAVAFGLYVGYLAWTNDSFPTQTRPFQDYAAVTSTEFNGTEFAFHIRWLNSDFVPYQAQLTSSTTDAANTPVCALQLGAVQSNQSIFMPFTIASPSAVLSNVDLSIGVKSPTTGADFTIVYSVATIQATNGNILPSDVTCQQPPGGE